MSSNYRGRGGGYPPSDDYYSREDPYSRAPQREDPYEQDPYGRTQTADPYSREDPYGRTKPPSDVRYRSDPYLRDDSADELDTRGPSDYRERPDRPRNKSYAPTSRPGKSVVAPSPNVLYELEHLATFTVSPKQGLVRPADGVKRLRDMEATSGVWALRVQLRLDRREIIIIEKANQKELECFQISRVSNPTFIMSSSSDDLYNNIVLFTVQSEAGPRMPSEMHLFQCIGNSGQDVADDIEAAISGKFPRTPAIKETRRPRSMSPRSWDDNLSALSGFEDLVRPEVPPVRQEFYNPPPKINKVPVPPPQPKNNDDVTMLNHCFDDIESFVASLQQAANAQKELERRRMMNGSRDPAEETLRARAQPPPLADFVSTLQKFKLAFNLLPKLQLLLKDPDATQLLSMLFGPLSLVVNASRDERGVPTIAQKVDSPLLTAEACRMMLTCLNQNESDLLKSLGPAWITPRFQLGKAIMIAEMAELQNGDPDPSGLFSDRWMGTPPPQYIPRFNVVFSDRWMGTPPPQYIPRFNVVFSDRWIGTPPPQYIPRFNVVFSDRWMGTPPPQYIPRFNVVFSDRWMGTPPPQYIPRFNVVFSDRWMGTPPPQYIPRFNVVFSDRWMGTPPPQYIPLFNVVFSDRWMGTPPPQYIPRFNVVFSDRWIGTPPPQYIPRFNVVFSDRWMGTPPPQYIPRFNVVFSDRWMGTPPPQYIPRFNVVFSDRWMGTPPPQYIPRFNVVFSDRWMGTPPPQYIPRFNVVFSDRWMGTPPPQYIPRFNVVFSDRWMGTPPPQYIPRFNVVFSDRWMGTPPPQYIPLFNVVFSDRWMGTPPPQYIPRFNVVFSDRWMGTPPPQYIPRFNDGWQHPGFSMTDVGASLPSNQPYNAPFQQNGNYPGPSSYGQTTESYGNPYGQPEVSWQSNNYPQQVTGQGPSQGFQQAPPQGPPMQPQGYPQGQIPGMVPQPQGIPQGQAPGMPPQSQPQPQALPPPKPNPSQQRYLDDLRSRGARICIAAAAREGKNAKELNVNTGDVVEVLDSSKNWWKVKNHTDQSGFVPNTLLTPYSQ